MSHAERQLQRLGEIDQSLKARPAALALIALGLVGREQERFTVNHALAQAILDLSKD